MKKNVLIVNYNTTLLTQCCIKSVNKVTPGCKIYVFDNSDNEPFVNIFENVEVIDNTKGQIINFSEWLNGFKEKVASPNNYASAKHCYTIEKCMEIIGDNFVLLDSDVLLKRDISDLFDENYIYVADNEKWQGNERVIPYCCFINVNLCKKNNIHYFNEKYINGLTPSCRYDTGANFYLECKNFQHKKINYRDYVVHLDDGSQYYNNKGRQESFLNNNKKLWSKVINICIVHYNTPLLTECLIKSINKFTPDSKIYIFDNSDKEPFTYRQNNIVYIDNTKGQIIDFDEWGKNYPNKTDVFYSSKHGYSIQKCIEIINQPFILLDSDVLLKRNISDLYDEKLAFIGEARDKSKRIVPFICFINPQILNNKNILYFDDNYTFDLYKNGKGKERFDTGCMLYLNKKILPHKIIKTNDYIEHYSAGSYEKNVFNILHKGQISKKDWLEKNKNLWEGKNENNMVIDNYRQDILTRGKRIGLNFDLDNPKTIQDKIQWLKLHDSTPLKTKCADKIKVHKYCEEKLGKDICVPILKVYNNIDEINWDELPQRFVIKCNHGSGMNIIVKDKFKLNKQDAINKLNKWMSTDFAFQNGCELQYHDIERKIFVEEFIGKEKGDITDYKFSCFNGVPRILQVMNDRYSGKLRFNYYDMNFKPLYCSRNDHPANYNIKDEKPVNFDLMIKYVKKLSEDFKFVRVDFYEINSTLYLGELTFTPNSGFFKYNDNKFSKMFGDWLDLEGKKNKKVVYTCIAGNYDTLLEPQYVTEGFDYVCFTDQPFTSDVWEIKPIPEELNNLSGIKKQRNIKINAHKYLSEYDFSVWVDANTELKGDINEYIKKNCSKKDISVYVGKHPQRDCIYKEAKAVIRIKKDTKENVDKQIKIYKKEGFPERYGLLQSCILLRYHNEESCKKLMETWWEQVKEYSHRDQLSFNYALWKNQDVKIQYLDTGIFNCETFKWNIHHKPQKITTNKIEEDMVKKQVKKTTPVVKKVVKKETPKVVKKEVKKVEPKVVKKVEPPVLDKKMSCKEKLELLNKYFDEINE